MTLGRTYAITGSVGFCFITFSRGFEILWGSEITILGNADTILGSFCKTFDNYNLLGYCKGLNSYKNCQELKRHFPCITISTPLNISLPCLNVTKKFQSYSFYVIAVWCQWWQDPNPQTLELRMIFDQLPIKPI
jgi:hypothetical protein